MSQQEAKQEAKKEPKTKVQIICQHLSQYYHRFNKDYDNLFSAFCDENGIDDEGVANELAEPPHDSMIIDFDQENFPYTGNPNDKEKYIHSLLNKCYKNENIVLDVPIPIFDEKFFNITENDSDEMKQIMQTQCPKLYTAQMANDSSLLKILAIGYKNNFDYFHHLVDSWFRYKIKHQTETTKPKDISDEKKDDTDKKKQAKIKNISDWIENNSHFARLKKINLKYAETAYELASTAVESFPNRICPQLMLQPLVQIDDSLEMTIKYIESACTFIATLMDESAPDRTMRAICPFQFDICIASGKPIRNPQTIMPDINEEFDEEDDDDDDDDEVQQKAQAKKAEIKYIDTIGDIKQKLKKNNLPYKTDLIEPGMIQQQRVFIKLFNQMEVNDNDSKNEDKFYNLHKKRLVAFVDRRNAAPYGKDPIYLYRPPANCAKLENNAVTASFISLSRTCLLPNMQYGDGKEALTEVDLRGKDTYHKTKHANIGSSFHCGGSLLTLSFLVKKVDEIKVYLYWNGQIIRFMPEDVENVLPLLFNMDWNNGANREYINQTKDINDRINEMQKIIKDAPFQAFQQQFT